MKPDERFVEEAREILKKACTQFEQDFPGAALPDSLRPDIALALSSSYDQGRRDENEWCAKVINTAIEEAHRVITTCRSNGSETHLDRWQERLICLEGLANILRQRISKGEGVWVEK